MSNCSCERWLQCITCSIPRGSFNLTKNKNQPLNCQRRINTPPPWAIRIVFISFSIGSIGSVLDIILQAFLLLFQKPCRIIFYLCLLISTCVYLCLSISPRATSIWLYNKFHRHLQTSSMQLLPKYQIFAIILSLIQLIPSITFVLSVTLSYIHGTMPHVIIILSFVRLRRPPSPSHRSLRII